MNAQVLDTEIRNWIPHKVQEEFLRLPRTVLEGFYGGAAGGGKSDVLLMYPLIKGWIKHPQFNGIIFRRTYPELEKSLIQKSLTGIGLRGPSYKDFGGTYNGTNRSWKFPSGAAIHFGYSQREKDVHQHDTSEFQYLGIDELTHFTEYQYSYLAFSRVRSVHGIDNLPPTVRCASNPGNIGHSWVRGRFVEPARKGRVLIRGMYKDKVSGEVQESKRIWIPATAYDNPFLMAGDPEYIARLRMLPEAERKAKLEGDWWVYAGAVFPEFRQLHYEGEPDHAVHVVDPFDVPLWWPKIVYLDWGFEAMTYAGVLGISPWDRTYQIEEFHWRRKNIPEWGAELSRGLQKYNQSIVSYIVDPSCNKKLGSPETIWQQIIAATDMPWELGDNDRISGISAIHEGLRWRPRKPRFAEKKRDFFSEESAERIRRQYGSDAYDEYIAMFEPDVIEKNLPKLQIFRTCPILIDTIPQVVHADSKASGKKVEDYAEFDGDDPIDGFRYGMLRVKRFMEQSKAQYEQVKKVEVAINQFKRSGNYADLDRTLSAVEHEEDRDHRPFRRGSHRSRLLQRVRGFARPVRRHFYSLH